MPRLLMGACVTRAAGMTENTDSIRPDAVLDAVGLYCPVPIIRTSERLKRLEAGAILEILSDDRVILIDMPAWCRSTGNEYLGSRQEGSEYHLFVRKISGAAAADGQGTGDRHTRGTGEKR
ncbi:MAG TPA: sulfurtransferase TusA family protein [Candidatus Polarisedimenticolia bacterium]|nr:sulfurtransferase TusA family protein [Candidatus Polarisedimenticolia bacterium]